MLGTTLRSKNTALCLSVASYFRTSFFHTLQTIHYSAAPPLLFPVFHSSFIFLILCHSAPSLNPLCSSFHLLPFLSLKAPHFIPSVFPPFTPSSPVLPFFLPTFCSFLSFPFPFLSLPLSLFTSLFIFLLFSLPLSFFQFSLLYLEMKQILQYTCMCYQRLITFMLTLPNKK